jgi:hypothetical protein
MKRSMDEAIQALKQQIAEWAKEAPGPSSRLKVWVYPPEWEARIPDQLTALGQECQKAGRLIELFDIGQGFLAEAKRRTGFLDKLEGIEVNQPDRVLDDLKTLANRLIQSVFRSPVASPIVCRVLYNSGSISTFVSYSAITNELYGSEEVPSPNVLAFPGEGDERYLNLLHLRADTNYRVARI